VYVGGSGGGPELSRVPGVLLQPSPMDALLGAFQLHPDAAWLVLGEPSAAEAVARLVQGRNRYRFGTVLQAAPERLCAILEPKSRPRLWQLLAAGCADPRELLAHAPVQAV
jgi:hypothetical protein